jgi:hypothetical protein
LNGLKGSGSGSPTLLAISHAMKQMSVKTTASPPGWRAVPGRSETLNTPKDTIVDSTSGQGGSRMSSQARPVTRLAHPNLRDRHPQRDLITVSHDYVRYLGVQDSSITDDNDIGTSQLLRPPTRGLVDVSPS